MKAYPKAIQEIHTAFICAGEQLLQEAKKILETTDERQIAKANLLSSLGFNMSSDVKKAKPIIEAGARAKEVSRLIMEWQFQYPNHKFITTEMVTKICEKYGLICGPVGRYTGFVPAKNLADISNFEKTVFKHREHRLGDIVDLTEAKFNNKDAVRAEYPDLMVPADRLEVDRLYSRYKTRYLSMVWGKTTTINVPNLAICAPEKDMNLKGLKKKGKFFTLITTRHIPDPVVLKPVFGGYLIVTAWGDEASDPLVVNERNN